MLKKIIIFSLVIRTAICFAYELPTITVSVVGQLQQKEERIVEVHISEKALNAAEASALALERQNEIEKVLYELGIPESNISSGNHYSYSENSDFFAKKSILVNIPDNVDIQSLCQSVINTGAAGYNDYATHGFIETGMQDVAENPKTMEEAVLLAEKKARRLASAFNADIGNIISIKELSYGAYNEGSISFEVTYKLLY